MHMLRTIFKTDRRALESVQWILKLKKVTQNVKQSFFVSNQPGLESEVEKDQKGPV